MKTKGKINGIFVFLVVVFAGIGFSWSIDIDLTKLNVNTLAIVPQTQTSFAVSTGFTMNVHTGRYFCPMDLSVMAIYGGGSGFSNCVYSLKFDKGLSGEYLRVGSAFDHNFGTWRTSAGYDILTVAEGKEFENITDTVECSKIRVTADNTSDELYIYFVDIDGNYPSSHDFGDTSDGLNLTYGGSDTLTGIQNLKINLFACPCTLDEDGPIISDWMVGDDTFVVDERYQGYKNIQFLVYDKGGTPRSYWTQGTKNFTNYTGAGVPANMDNQEGVNSSTIEVKIYSGDTLIATKGSENLIITEYTGSTNIPEFTWDGNTRGYLVSFPVDLGSDLVEVPIRIEVSVSDNELHNGGDCETDANTTTDSITLNQKIPPVITFNHPIGQHVNPNAGVKLTVSDNWAGVNTGSLIVEILPIMSGGQVIMSGSVYSGSDLHFDLIDGSGELGGASKYEVTFQPIYEFALDADITLSGYVEDLLGTTGHNTHVFHTRADCSFYGCINFVDIFLGDNTGHPILGNFTGSLIVVTGTVAEYPYLTGENMDIVMCGPIGDKINLTGNIDIYSGDQRINGNPYLSDALYVTGLDFEYQSGVITPRY